MELETMGIDLGKTIFHVVGLSAAGEVMMRRKFSRTQLLRFTANLSGSAESRKHQPRGKGAHGVRIISRRFAGTGWVCEGMGESPAIRTKLGLGPR